VLNFNVTYDSSITSQSQSFQTMYHTAVNAALAFFQSEFTNNVTVNITFAWGGTGANFVAENNFYYQTYSYAQIVTALKASQHSADDIAAYTTLPVNDPTGTGHLYGLTTGQAMALGLTVGFSHPYDDYVTLSSDLAWTFDPNNRAVPGKYDAIGAMEHEITEGIFGRIGSLGSASAGLASGVYTPLDLFRYSAAGVRDFNPGHNDYFSIDGQHLLTEFNNHKQFGGDVSDWYPTIQGDSFGDSYSGVAGLVTATDLRELDILGWTLASSLPDLTAGSLTLSATAAGTSVGYQINNVGGAAAGASTTGIYLSTDSTISSADALLTTASTPSLTVGGVDSEIASLSFPGNLTPGTYYIGALSDYNGQVTEGDETNNASNAIPVILGNNSANTLTGTAGDDTIFGLGGNDTINGGAGADVMIGGIGDDVYYVDNPGDVVIENANEGNDIVYASVDYTIGPNIESVVLVEGAGDINVVGNSMANALVGNSGDNTLDGKGGNDTMIGGAGDDIYFVDSTSDLVVENPNEGNDIVYASVDYTIGPNIESVVLIEGAGNINAAGSDTANALVGNSGNNTLDGKGGDDTMIGGAGNDIYFVDSTSDLVVEKPNEGNDIVYASVDYTIGPNVESLVLIEGAGNINGSGSNVDNAIVGNSGNNVIDGGGGHDLLTGNAGNDTFVFASGEANGDAIVDFSGNGAAAGDSFRFTGFGTAAQGATFTEIGTTNQWQIHSGLDAHNEVITLLNSASVHPSDYILV
jgi:Ca2+-binding RTX toxin-like protein